MHFRSLYQILISTLHFFGAARESTTLAGGAGFELRGARFGVWFFKACDLSACLPLTSLVLFPLGGLNPFCAGIDDSASRPIPLLESDSCGSGLHHIRRARHARSSG